MNLRFKLSNTFFLIQLLILSISPSASAQEPSFIISTPEQIKEEFASVPCKNADRMNAVRTLFERVGASSSDISVDKYKDVENLVIRKPGSSSEKIVIGAHYDSVSDGCGAIDNWTGIVVLAHIYKTLKDVPLKKTLLFVAFGKEEKGLVGSRAMANSIHKEEIAQYCGVINIDSLGLVAPQVADNLSSSKLAKLAAEIAREMKLPFNHSQIDYAQADSISFKSKKIPALTIHGLNEDWGYIIHTAKDQAALVNHVSVYLGYRLVLALVARLNASACDAYR